MRKFGTDVRKTLLSGSKVLIDGQACSRIDSAVDSGKSLLGN